jgi:hypothetical protein
MRLIVMDKTVADKVRGVWRRFKENNVGVISPVEVKAGTHYILNLDAILAIKPNLKDIKYFDLLKENVQWFTVGDGSLLDQKYQQYLAAQAAKEI